jgi:hypothetical protein
MIKEVAFFFALCVAGKLLWRQAILSTCHFIKHLTPRGVYCKHIKIVIMTVKLMPKVKLHFRLVNFAPRGIFQPDNFKNWPIEPIMVWYSLNTKVPPRHAAWLTSYFYLPINVLPFENFILMALFTKLKIILLYSLDMGNSSLGCT